MGAKTGIEWTDATWNPIRGCTRVSEGCRNCYAESVAYRFSGPGLPYEGLAVLKNGHASWTGKVEFVEKRLLDPLKWKGRPLYQPGNRKPVGYEPGKRIFVNSMSDLFHENVTDEMRDKIFAVMALCPQHIFQVLTKRPARMLEYFKGLLCGRISFEAARIIEANWPRLKAMPEGFRWSVEEPFVCRVSGGVGEYWPLPNVWLGVSVENQAAADERIPLLSQTPAAVRFISAEPLLGELTIPEYVYLPRAVRSDLPFPPFLVARPGIHAIERNPHGAVATRIDGRLLGLKPDEFELLPTLDWVICGGESGPGARPMHPEWARGLRDQCAVAGVPFFFKQWGEHAFEVGLPDYGEPDFYLHVDGRVVDEHVALQSGETWQGIWRVGKHAAGALLDGQEWKQFPEQAAER